MDATSRRRYAKLLLDACTSSSGLGHSDAVELLRLLRKSGQSSQHNHLVATLGSRILEGSWLGDESLSLCEQVGLALVRSHRLFAATELLSKIKEYVPKSYRSERLAVAITTAVPTPHGRKRTSDIIAESMSKLDANLAVSRRAVGAAMAGCGVAEEYKEAIEVDMSQLPEGTPQPTVTKVRMAAPGTGGESSSAARRSRDTDMASTSDSICQADGVLALKRHLQTNADDQASWKVLAEQQASLGNFREACFCFEELVMLSPGTAHYHCRLAECLASTGLPADREAARRHAAVAVETSRGRLPRALVLVAALGPSPMPEGEEDAGAGAEEEGRAASEVGRAALEAYLKAVEAKAAGASSPAARGALTCVRALRVAVGAYGVAEGPAGDGSSAKGGGGGGGAKSGSAGKGTAAPVGDVDED